MALLDFDAAVVTNPAAPKHDFTDVSSEDCLACHQEEIHQESLCKHGNTEAHQEMLVAAKGIPELTARLETVKQENRSLQIIAPVSLGLGIGIAPELVVTASGMTERVDYIDVASPLPALTIGLCSLRQRLFSPVVKSLWDVAEQTYHRAV